MLLCFVVLNVPVIRYCHVRTVTSDCVGVLPDVKMNDTSCPTNKHRRSKQLRRTCLYFIDFGADRIEYLETEILNSNNSGSRHNFLVPITCIHKHKTCGLSLFLPLYSIDNRILLLKTQRCKAFRLTLK